MLMSYPKYIALYYIFVISVVFTNGTRIYVELAHELPMKSDLDDYVQSLKSIVNFCIQNKNYLDLNFIFGLFLLNVNLKHTIYASTGLPQLLRNDFDDIFNKNDKLLNYFQQKVKMMNKSEQNEVDILIASLFSKEHIWSKRMPTFSSTSSKAIKDGRHLQNRYTYLEWEKYRNDVNDFEKWTPSPKQSDMCMASLAIYQNNNFNKYPVKCEAPESCSDMLQNGTDFGYALQHRLLFMLIGRLARGCNIFSPNQDTFMRINYCTKAYFEAEYIARHDFEIVDLFIEQICLCTLDGHAHFLQRTWLSSILRYQKQNGCFGENLHRIPVPDDTKVQTIEEWKISKNDHSLLDGVCNGHLTSAATGAISASIRYIMETYYNKD